MRNRKFLLIGVAIATLFLMVTSFASVMAISRPTGTSKDKVVKTSPVLRRGVYRAKAGKSYPVVRRGAYRDAVVKTYPIVRRGVYRDKAVKDGSIVRRGVYRFNKEDFNKEKMRPIWNGKRPTVVPAPAPMKDLAL